MEDIQANDLCTGYDRNSIHQIQKKDLDTNPTTKYNIFPLTYIQAVYDARDGRRLDTILEQCNNLYVYWKGSREATRLQLPMYMRRRGIMITYRDGDDNIITEQCINADCIADDVFGKDENWELISYRDLTEEDLRNVNKYGFNVTVFGMKGGTHTLESAIKDVPYDSRILGQKITFAQNCADWVTYQFQQLSLDGYENPSNWKQLEGIYRINGELYITNQPDEEDITSDGNNLLKFADKEHSEEAFSGLGRVYLRKNIQTVNYNDGTIAALPVSEILETAPSDLTDSIAPEGDSFEIGISKDGKAWAAVYDADLCTRYLQWNATGDYKADSEYLDSSDNLKVGSYICDGIVYDWNGTELVEHVYEKKTINLMSQDMFIKANTRYIIQYDYDLNSTTITIPEGCVLEFQGGSLRNGTITGNNTFISAYLLKIFTSDISIDGSWNVREAHPEWFGATTNDKNVDCTEAIQKCLDSFDITILQNATYYINGNKTIEVPKGKSLFGCNKPIMQSTYNIELISYEALADNEFIVLKLNSNTEIKNISINGIENKNGLIGIGSDSVISRVYVRDSICTNFDIGIRLKCYLSKIYNTQVRFCNIGFEVRNLSDENPSNITSTILTGCYASDCYRYGYRIIRLTYGTIIGCAADRCGIDSRIDISERANNMGYPYYFQQCYGCSMINCGTEGSANILYTIKLQGFSVKNCIFVISGRNFDDSNFDYSRLINFINPVNVEFDKNCIERSNANIPSSPKFIYVYNDNSIYDRYVLLKLNQITLSIPNMNNLWRGIELDGDYCTTGSIDVDNGIKKKGDYYSDELYEVNLESGRQFYNTRNNTLLIWDSNSWRYADGNEVSASRYGDLENIPTEEEIRSGFIYWCTDYLSPILWTGNSWRTFDGFAPGLKQGSSANRPVFESTNYNRGFNYWDGNLQKPIWWSSSGWIMADGNPADAKRFGDTNSKPNLSRNIVGFCYFDTNSKKPIWWTGSNWVDANGNSNSHSNKGDTASRPTLTSSDSGFMYYDTDLSKYIVWSGSAWTNVDGTALV